MAVTYLELDFLQRVYLLMEQTNSIVTTVQAWVNDDELAAHYGDLLSKNPLAQKIVGHLKLGLWDVAFIWECENDQMLSIQELRDFEKDFCDEDTSDSNRDQDWYAMDLKKLKQAAQIATEVLRDIFKHYFLMLPLDSLSIPDELIRALKSLERSLPHKLYWLQQVLAGYVIKTNQEQHPNKIRQKPKNSARK